MKYCLSLTADDLTIIAMGTILFIKLYIYLEGNASMINEQSFNKIFKPVLQNARADFPFADKQKLPFGRRLSNLIRVTGRGKAVSEAKTQQPNHKMPAQRNYAAIHPSLQQIYKNAEYLFAAGFLLRQSKRFVILKTANIRNYPAARL